MTVDHLGGSLTYLTYQTFGYVTAAEGFIFLSGFVFAIVYSRYINDRDMLLKRCFKRAWVIYKYHITLILIMLALSYLIPKYQSYWQDWLGVFSMGTSDYISYGLLFLHQPRYMGVLPIYFLFLLVSPLLLIAISKGKIGQVLVISFILWISGQYFNPLKALSNEFCSNCNPGFFNLFGWQIIWVIGLALGYIKYSGQHLRIASNKYLFVIVFSLSLILFLSRHEFLDLGFDTALAANRNDLGWLRLLNFILIVFLISYFIRNISINRGIPWVMSLGQYSLQVYSFHVLLIYLLLPLKWRVIQIGGEAGYVFYTLLTIFMLTLPVVFYRKYQSITLHVKK